MTTGSTGTPKGTSMYDSFRPGQTWLDTNGHRIHAHGGSLLFEGGVYYWYGENKEHSKPGSGIWTWGIRCYTSTDLYNWQDRGLIIPPVLDDRTSPLHPSQMIDRPHIIHNPHTGTYVCWLKIMGVGGEQLCTVLTADSLLGPYEIVRTGLSPLGMSAGDFDLVVDPADGKAYYYFERVHSELICAELNDDYTDLTGAHSTHLPRPHPPLVREAPAYFRRGDKHYLITSGTTWYFPNPSEAAVADTYHGPFTVLGDPHPTDPSGTSFRSQISSVFQHPDHDDLYIAIADRWLPQLSEEESNWGEAFQRHYSAKAEGREAPSLVLPEADTSVADHVWLPIRFDGEMPVIEWHDEWRIEDTK
ncbi:family 43 glycosylhydrolase [Streptomyces sp. NPDC049687]|uniref:family 43 glycosylhydrolase n=1 Tax=Streptomyces sp. NPDC049687 TaxID=3365596 RepID=UPI0037B0254D